MCAMKTYEPVVSLTFVLVGPAINVGQIRGGLLPIPLSPNSKNMSSLAFHPSLSLIKPKAWLLIIFLAVSLNVTSGVQAGFLNILK